MRLPAIYGIHMKKNFIYDYIHVTPAMLNQAKYEELKEKDPFFNKILYFAGQRILPVRQS